MPKITVMSWNIENFGQTKFDPNNGGDALVSYVANAIKKIGADVVGLLEIRSGIGDTLVNALVKELNALTSPKKWQGVASIQFCLQRQEQYVVLWNTKAVTTYKVNVNGTQTFVQYQFANPKASQPNQPAWLGFPQQITSNRPPFLVYFQTVKAPVVKLPMAFFHAPSPGYWPAVKRGCNNLAEAAELTGAGASVLVMGDFNVKFSDKVSTPGTFGAISYGPLAGTAGKFTQLLQEVQSSLITVKNAFTNMQLGDIFSQPYDNIFLRKNAQNIKESGVGVENLVEDSQKGKPLAKALGKIELAIYGMAPTYSSVEAAFIDYRTYVSDHMPVSVDVTY